MIWLIYKLYFFYWQSELFRKILSSTKASTTIWLQKLFFKSALFKKIPATCYFGYIKILTWVLGLVE